MTSERSSRSFQTHRLVPSAPPPVRVCNGHKSSSDSRGAAISAFSIVNTGPVVVDYGSTMHHHVKDTSRETAPSWLSSTAVSPLSATSSTVSQLKLSNWQTFYHLLSFITGTGMLCLPLALVEINWYGVLLLIAAAIVSSYTSKLLVDALDAVRWLRGTSVSFSDLGQECFGAPGKLITSVLVHVSLLISSTGYLTLASWCLVDVLGLQYGTVMVLVAMCVWFQVLVPSLRMLAVLSIVNVAFSFWIESVILGDAMYPLKQIALEHSDFVFVTPDLSNVTMMGKLSYTFSLLLGGLFGHSIIPTLYNAMADPGQCSTVVVRTKLGTTALLYLPVCCLTYAVYGATLQAPVFFNMRNTVVRDLAIVLYTIHLLLSYTITLFPLQRACEQWIVQTSRRSNDRDSLLETTAAHGNLLFTTSSPELCRREQDGPCGGVRTTARVLCRSVIVLLTLVLGYFSAPSTLVIFAWMLIPTALLALVLPCVFYCQLCSEDATKTDRVASVVISVLAIVTACWSLAVIIEC
uniref:Amino acid transporter transmembrane domain-containing protein n=1 Tax=Hyaloperonospora arabidopsidis (strain Emoy2) TaxID=559515 RepID=M4BF94_HYAAE